MKAAMFEHILNLRIKVIDCMHVAETFVDPVFCRIQSVFYRSLHLSVQQPAIYQ